MTGYKIIQIKEMVKELGEESCIDILSQFSCSLNADVETFLRDKNKVIEFAKQGIAISYLVFASYKDKPVLVAYFTLASKKPFVVKTSCLNSRLRDRLKKFAEIDKINKAYQISCPLIAQLGKNDKYPDLITGDELLKMACDKVKEAQSIIGGNVVYLECENTPKLINFYKENGFFEFGVVTTKEKTNLNTEKQLVQMLKYL